MKDNLFDASSLLNVIKNKASKALYIINKQCALDLTIYEVSNTIWRIAYLEKKITSEQACILLDSILLLLERMKTLDISGLQRHVKEIAIKEGLTVYDASYLVVAERKNLVLVTDDKQLERAAKKYIKVMRTNDL